MLDSESWLADAVVLYTSGCEGLQKNNTFDTLFLIFFYWGQTPTLLNFDYLPKDLLDHLLLPSRQSSVDVSWKVPGRADLPDSSQYCDWGCSHVPRSLHTEDQAGNIKWYLGKIPEKQTKWEHCQHTGHYYKDCNNAYQQINKQETEEFMVALPTCHF